MNCDSFLLSGSWNCPGYSRKRHGQPHRLAAQCCHDAEAHGPAWPRPDDWDRLLWRHSREKGNLLFKKHRNAILLGFLFYFLNFIVIFIIRFQGSNQRPGRKLKVLRIHRSNMWTSAASGLIRPRVICHSHFISCQVVTAHFKPWYVL